MNDESVQELDDDRLMAYVDGELNDSERAEVEEALGIDQDFRAKLEEISRAGSLVDDVLKNIMHSSQHELVAEIDSAVDSTSLSDETVSTEELIESTEPDVEHLETVLEEIDSSFTAEVSANDIRKETETAEAVSTIKREETSIVSFVEETIEDEPLELNESVASAIPLQAETAVEQKEPEVEKQGSRWLANVMSVVAVSLAGYGGYYYGQHQVAPIVGEIVPTLETVQTVLGVSDVAVGTPLFSALQNIPSNELYTSAGKTVLPVISFQANDGRYCRQFEMNASSTVSMGLACKSEGGWRLEALLAAGERLPDGESFQTASIHYKDAMSVVFDYLWDGGHLNQAQELKLIQQGW